ncbi:MAG: peptidoglycan DD-metalloendopeptidase family protein [Bacteroidales bacterium]|nr:peptidoglycan DD-metalloendopeptidase family protein [Candidatus Cacconaster merdequi]
MKRFAAILLIVLTALPCTGQDVSRQAEQKRRIEEEISFINNQLKSLGKKQKASTEELMLIQRKVAERKKLIKGIDSDIHRADDNIVQKQRAINRLQRELDTLSAYYSKLIYNTYRNRDTKVWFMYILGSEDIGQGFRRFTYLKELASAVNTQGEKIKEKQRLLESERAELVQAKAAAQKLRRERELEYKKLTAEENASKKSIRNLSKTEKQYRTELARKRSEVERLNREIQKLLNSTIEGQKKDHTQIDYALADKFESNRGRLPWPLKQGVVVEHFGINRHPVYKNLKLPDNNGVTFSTGKGAQVYSVFDGVVKQIVVMPGYNQCVLVQHGTYFTFYCKLGKVSVKSGQTITTGTVLGTLEPEGNRSTLHFQIWKGTLKQNPEEWMMDM